MKIYYKALLTKGRTFVITAICVIAVMCAVCTSNTPPAFAIKVKDVNGVIGDAVCNGMGSNWTATQKQVCGLGSSMFGAAFSCPEAESLLTAADCYNNMYDVFSKGLNLANAKVANLVNPPTDMDKYNTCLGGGAIDMDSPEAAQCAALYPAQAAAQKQASNNLNPDCSQSENLGTAYCASQLPSSSDPASQQANQSQNNNQCSGSGTNHGDTCSCSGGRQIVNGADIPPDCNKSQNSSTDPKGIMTLTGNDGGAAAGPDLAAFGGEPSSTDTTIGAAGQ